MTIDDEQSRREAYFFPPSEPIRFPPEILSILVNRTINQPNTEFWYLLIGRGNIVSTIIEIGTPGHNRNVPPHDLEQKIKDVIAPYTARGLSIVADYHTHTMATVEKYRMAHLPQVAAIIPSPPDIDQWFVSLMEKIQGKWPRMIGAVMDSGRVAMSAWDILRRYTLKPNELEDFEILDPVLLPYAPPPSKTTRMGIRSLRGTISDPIRMIKNSWVKPRRIDVDGLHRLPVDLNAIQTTYRDTLYHG